MQMKFTKAVIKNPLEIIEVNSWKVFEKMCKDNEINPEAVFCRFYSDNPEALGWSEVWAVFEDKQHRTSEGVMPIAFSSENILKLKKVSLF